MRPANQTFLRDFVLLGFPASVELQPLQFFAFLMVYLLSLAFNFLIIGVVCRDSRLHSPMYFFITVFSFLEICYTSVTMPRLLNDLYSQNKAISTFLCISQFYFLFALGSTENFLLSAMAYDRYVAICHPLRYMSIVTQNVCLVIVLGSWMGGFLAPVLPAVFLSTTLFCGTNEIDHFYCDFPPLLHHFCNINETYKIEIIFFLLACAVILGNFLFISFVTLISYIYIISTVLKSPTSNGRKKSFSTCVSHLTVVSIFYGTLIFMYVRPSEANTSYLDKILSVFYSVVTPLLNPIIYSLRNTNIKSALKTIVKRQRNNKW
uniref:Olfactory receptor n=1 Tax=Leptobrachium leishanense TaxID=445787 RepID=A0A8C5QMM2_9ANUR